MVETRKLVTTRETIFSELGVAAPRPVVRAVLMAVIVNLFAGRSATLVLHNVSVSPGALRSPAVALRGETTAHCQAHLGM